MASESGPLRPIYGSKRPLKLASGIRVRAGGVATALTRVSARRISNMEVVMRYLVEITYIKEIEAKDGHEAVEKAADYIPFPNPPGFYTNVETTTLHD